MFIQISSNLISVSLLLFQFPRPCFPFPFSCSLSLVSYHGYPTKLTSRIIWSYSKKCLIQSPVKAKRRPGLVSYSLQTSVENKRSRTWYAQPTLCFAWCPGPWWVNDKSSCSDQLSNPKFGCSNNHDITKTTVLLWDNTDHKAQKRGRETDKVFVIEGIGLQMNYPKILDMARV